MCRLSFRVVGVLLVMFFVGVFTSMLLAQPVAVSRDLHSRVASNDLSNHSADVNLPKLLIPDDAVIVPYQPDNITPSKLPKPEDLITPDQSVLVPLRLHLDMLDLINSSDLLRAKPRKQLPARIAVSSSEYLVTELPQTGEELVLQGKIHLYLYADDAELWLFNLSNGAIESPQLDGKPASISSASRTKFALLIAGKGEHVFSFKVRVKIHQQGGWRIAEGVLPTASASKVNLTLPTEAGDLLTGNQLDLRKWSSGKDAAGEKKSITTSLEPDGHFAWRWRSAISEGQVDRSLEVDSTIRFDLQDDAAWIIWKPTFKISHGKWDFFRLQIPKKYTIAEIVGENLRGWNIVEDAGNTGNTDNAENADNTDNTKKNDVQIINIELLKPAEKVETILIRLMESDAKIKSDVNGEVWKLSTLSVPEAGIHRGTIELYRSTIRSFRVTNAVGASLTDPPKNPLPTTSTKFDATSPLGVIPFQSYRFISEPFELTFASKRTEKQFSTKFQSVLKVTRQNTKLESKIEIYANNQPFFATITLPNQLNLKNVSLPDGIAYSKEAKDGKNLLYISNGSGIHNSVVVGIDGEYAQAKKFDNTKDNPKNINVQKNDTPKNEPPKPNTEPETIDDNSPETEVPPIIAPVHLADSILPTIQESTAPESTPAESNKSTPSQPESVVGKQYLIDELPVFSIKFAGSDLVQGSKSEYIELITEPSLVADAVKLVNCNIVDRQRSGYSTITPKDQLGLLRLVIRSYSQKFSGQLIFTEIDPIVRCSTITNVLTTNEAVEETILFDFSIERSGIREIKFTLPAWMRDAVIESPFLQRKRIAEREVGGGSNNAQSSGVVPARVVDVTLELQEDVIDRLSVLVRADRKLRTETDYKIVAPVVETGHVTSQYVVIENDRLSPDEMLVDSASIKNLKSLDRRQVEWNYLSSILGENVTEAYYSQKNESKQTNERSLRFRMKRRGAVRLSEARIDLAETSMIFDRNGEYRAEQIYHIDNKKEPYLDISLPKGGVILGVRLFSADEWNEAAMAEGWGVVHAGNGRHDEVRLLRDGMSVKPCLMSVEVAERYSQLKDVKKNLLEIQGSDMKYYANAARIPLVKTESGELDYVIRIVYAGSLNGFTNLGYVEMPFVDVLNIPVGESILLLNLPKQFQYFFNGNMQRIKDDQQISTLQKINLNYFTQLGSRLQKTIEVDNIYAQQRAVSNLQKIENSTRTTGSGSVIQLRPSSQLNQLFTQKGKENDEQRPAQLVIEDSLGNANSFSTPNQFPSNSESLQQQFSSQSNKLSGQIINQKSVIVNEKGSSQKQPTKSSPQFAGKNDFNDAWLKSQKLQSDSNEKSREAFIDSLHSVDSSSMVVDARGSTTSFNLNENSESDAGGFGRPSGAGRAKPLEKNPQSSVRTDSNRNSEMIVINGRPDNISSEEQQEQRSQTYHKGNLVIGSTSQIVRQQRADENEDSDLSGKPTAQGTTRGMKGKPTNDLVLPRSNAIVSDPFTVSGGVVNTDVSNNNSKKDTSNLTINGKNSNKGITDGKEHDEVVVDSNGKAIKAIGGMEERFIAGRSGFVTGDDRPMASGNLVNNDVKKAESGNVNKKEVADAQKFQSLSTQTAGLNIRLPRGDSETYIFTTPQGSLDLSLRTVSFDSQRRGIMFGVWLISFVLAFLVCRFVVKRRGCGLFVFNRRAFGSLAALATVLALLTFIVDIAVLFIAMLITAIVLWTMFFRSFGKKCEE